MSSPRSQGSAAWTKDSAELGFDTSSSVRATLGAEPSSGPGSPESRSPKTSVMSVTENQRGEVWLAPYAQALNQGGGKPGQGSQVILSVEGSPAKTSPSPDNAKDSPATGQDSSLSSPGSPMTLFGPEGMSSLRTYPDFFPAKTEEISRSFSRRWPSSGFTTAPGESWTADTSECPNDAAASSSLADVLEATVQPKYFLSPKAAAGILRRAELRGRVLPEHLETALRGVAGK